jgi:hypothetical protein
MTLDIGINFESEDTFPIGGATPHQALKVVREETYNGLMSGEDGRFSPVGGKMFPSYEEQRAAQKAAGVAMRFNAGKLRYDLLPPDAIEELVRVYTMGAAKYEDRNWEKGFDWMSCVASLKRHLAAFEMGEDRDAESNLLHMAHVAWNAIAVATFQLRGVGKDDRPQLV